MKNGLTLVLIFLYTLPSIAEHEKLQLKENDGFNAAALKSFHHIFPYKKGQFELIHGIFGKTNLFFYNKEGALVEIECEQHASFNIFTDKLWDEKVVFGSCTTKADVIRSYIEEYSKFLAEYAQKGIELPFGEVMVGDRKKLSDQVELVWFPLLIVGHGIAPVYSVAVIDDEKVFVIQNFRSEFCWTQKLDINYCTKPKNGLIEVAKYMYTTVN